jgi:hypothetical protein
MEALVAVETEARAADRSAPWLWIAKVALRIVVIYVMLAAVIAMTSANVHPFVYNGF